MHRHAKRLASVGKQSACLVEKTADQRQMVALRQADRVFVDDLFCVIDRPFPSFCSPSRLVIRPRRDGLFLCLDRKETVTAQRHSVCLDRAARQPSWLAPTPIHVEKGGALTGFHVTIAGGLCFKAVEFPSFFPLKISSPILANIIVDKIVDISANNFKSSTISLQRSRDRGPTGSARRRMGKTEGTT